MTADANQSQEHEACPLQAVDRRLDDLHRQWHAAESAYFDPEAFRVAIQSAIQTLRTVSFILQSNKRLIPDFDAWYLPWQEKMRADPLMRWMVDARNKIEKQGDLEAHSFIRAEIIASYLEEGPRVQVPANLSDGPARLLKTIPESLLGDHIRKNGVLRVERRWVENTLSDHELLDAVALAYGRIAEVIADAHRQLGLKPPQTTDIDTGEVYGDSLRRGRLPCMIGHAEARSLDLSLATGRPMEFETIQKAVDSSEAPVLQERYEIAPEDVYGKADTAENTLRGIFATGRTMFLKDGHHSTIMFLLEGAMPARISELRFDTPADKYLLMRKMAHEATKYGADGAIMIGEVWSAKADPENPYMRAADAADKRELLVATLVSRTGEPLQLSAEILRKGKAVSLAETQEIAGGAQFLYAPLYAAWGKPIPEAWMNRPGDA